MRNALFLLGVLVMVFALAIAAIPASPDAPRRTWAMWLFGLGLLLVSASHGWPEGVR